MAMKRVLVAGWLALLLLGIANGAVTLAGTAPLPMCDALPKVEAAPDLYRDSPVYVENEMEAEVLAWATGKPGFEGLWFDVDHNRWITVAFSRDADIRQQELATVFPGAGVVAVAVPWTQAQVKATRDYATDVLSTQRAPIVGIGTDITHGMIEVDTPELTPDALRRLDAVFGHWPVCVEKAEAGLFLSRT